MPALPPPGRCHGARLSNGGRNALLPAGRSYYKYSGSLTTPPCSEEVDWMLLTDSIAVDAADVARFAALYSLNARPAQKGFRRFVLQSA
jgi:carbonic anhydrase